jgi:hypothetical protein
MSAQINFVNIGIIALLLISGVLFTVNDSQKDKAAVVSGINEISSSVSGSLPSGAIQASMPEMSYDTVNNSVSVTQGFALFFVVMIFVFMFIGFSFLRGMVSCAKEV